MSDDETGGTPRTDEADEMEATEAMDAAEAAEEAIREEKLRGVDAYVRLTFPGAMPYDEPATVGPSFCWYLETHPGRPRTTFSVPIDYFGSDGLSAREMILAVDRGRETLDNNPGGRVRLDAGDPEHAREPRLVVWGAG